MATRSVAVVASAAGVWLACVLVPPLGASGQRTAAISVSPNRPYIAERAKLHFFNANSVETGGVNGFENVANFGGNTAAPNSRYVRLGLKVAKGQKLSVACAVAAKPGAAADRFEIVGPGLSTHQPLTSPHVTWTFSAEIAQWHWFTIAATAPWTFRSCTIAPLVVS